IVKVIAKAGDEVKKGEPIAVIEAMKMETNVLALRDGVIEKVYVKEADSVKSGQLIATLEPLANDDE
ncbi:biotin/lipoyl-containing protein, partial [Mogibacterium sp.]|uniref:biotin/lipoyl-containing protein n=1 Tax=Mogibacterium sp. TaxID=2049035 RepID=UPI0025D6D973